MFLHYKMKLKWFSWCFFYFGGTYYIGKWKIKEEFCRHGRGLLVYSNGNSYLGQWVNNKEEGIGRFYYNRLEYVNINWKNGKMDGIGELINPMEVR